MRKISEVAEDIKSILNNIERTEECTGETLVDINELVDEILTISCSNTTEIIRKTVDECIKIIEETVWRDTDMLVENIRELKGAVR